MHFYNDDSVSPGKVEGMGAMPALVSHVNFQTDIIRQTWEELKARLTENHWTADVTPTKETQSLNQKAEDFAELINSWGSIIEERLGYSLQAGMTDGQVIDCYAVLHWRRMDQFYPAVPEYEYLDELPEDEDERGRYKKEPEEEGEKAGKYRETAESLAERTKQKRARAGCPYVIEVLPADDVAFVDDVMGAEAMAVHMRTLGVLDYGDELNETDKIVLCADDTVGGKGLRVYLEDDAPNSWEAARGDWDQDKIVNVVTVWTRDSWYELASVTALTDGDTMSGGDWEIMKSGCHAFGRVPFVRVLAGMYHGSRDPRHRYLPASEGLYRRKPFFDRDMALTKGIAEWGLPRLVEVNLRGVPELGETGEETGGLADDTGMSDILPAGHDIRTVVGEVTRGQLLLLEMEKESLERSAPSTGVVEVQSNEKPWTARTRVQQENVGPKALLAEQRVKLRVVWRSIARDMSTPAEEYGLGGSAWAYKRGEDGQEDPRSIIGIEPGDIDSVMVGISIDGISSAEKITLVEHGVSLWAQGVLTMRQLFEEYFVVPNPLDREADVRAERVFKTQLEPGRIAMWVAKEFGSKYAIGIDGQLVGFGGKPVNPESTGMARGMRPVNPMGGGQQRSLGPLVDNVAGPANAIPQPAAAM